MTRSRKTGGPQRTKPPSRWSSASPRWWVLSIVVAGVTAYANSFRGPFIFDDLKAITQNVSIRALSNWGAVLFPAREVPTAGRPLVNLSFALNWAIGGLDVTGYHLWNLAIHLGCGLLVFGLVRRTTALPGVRDRVGMEPGTLAGIVALIWVVHPLNSEVVDYLTQRSESMMAACYLLTLYAAVRALRSAHRVKWESLAIVSCLCGMACKESMVTAPIAVMLYDRVFRFPSFQQALRVRWRLYAALALSWVLLFVLIGTGPRVHSVGLGLGVSPWTYLLNQSVMVTHYLRLAVWPRSLVIYYGWPAPLTLSDIWWHALIVGVLLVLTMVMLVRRPAFGFLGAWVFLTLAPTSSVVPIVTEVGAERRMYLPLIGVVVVLAIVSRRVWQRLSRVQASTIGWVGCGVVVVGLSLGTWARNREYASSLRLAQANVDRWPTSQAHAWLGEELIGAGEYDAAVTHLRLALPSAPRAHYTLGIEYFREEKWKEAIQEFDAFIQAQPLLAQVPLAHATMARAYATQGRWDEALAHAREGVTEAPREPETRGALADVLYKHRDFEDAITEYRIYLTLKPNDSDALTNMAIALAESGRSEEALEVFRRAAAANPESASTLQNLSMSLLEHSDVDEAVSTARRAVAINPNAAVLRTLLGRALARQGRIEEAVHELEHAVELDPKDPEPRAYLQQVPHANRPSNPR